MYIHVLIPIYVHYNVCTYMYTVFSTEYYNRGVHMEIKGGTFTIIIPKRGYSILYNDNKIKISVEKECMRLINSLTLGTLLL